MKKSMLLLVPFMMLVGCSINGINPFGASEVTGASGGLATFAIQVLEPSKGSIEVDEINVTNASFRLIPPVGATQNTNWAPGMLGFVLFNPITPGTANLRLIDNDALGVSSTNATNITIRSGYNYRIIVTLGGLIYMIETNAGASTVSNYMAVYSETHAIPALNNAFNPLNGGNLYVWTPGMALTEVGTGTWEGASNWAVTRPAGITNYIGFGISITNGAKDKTIYAGGHLKFAVKAFNANNTYSVGIQSITGAVTNDVAIPLNTIAGYVVDGNWHALMIPMSDFAGINFGGIYTYFYLTSTAIQTNTNTAIYLDDIYWSRD
jgi:hypothetical protein